MPFGFVWFDWISAKAALVFLAGVLTKSRGAIPGFFISFENFLAGLIPASQTQD
jgi:hypothetical protein